MNAADQRPVLASAKGHDPHSLFGPPQSVGAALLFFDLALGLL
jgi:hypothetical protein